MEEGHSKQKRWITFAVCMGVAVSIMLFRYFMEMKRVAVEYYQSQMTAIANDHAEKINKELEFLRIAGETAADMLSEKEKPGEADFINAASAILDSTDAFQVIYNTGEGQGILWDGESVQNIDLRECTYYRIVFRASRAEYVKIDGTDEEEAIMLVVPVGSSYSRNLLIFYSVNNIQEMLRVAPEFDSDSIAVLMHMNGKIIVDGDYNSDFLATPNLWDNVGEDYGEEVSKARVQIGNGISGCFEAVSKEGNESKTLVYAPILKNDWAVVIGVSQSLVDKRVVYPWKKGKMILYQMVGMIFIFIVAFTAVNIFNKKRNEENARKLREEAETDLLTGLTNKLSTEHRIKEYMNQYPNELAMMFVLDIDNFKKINDTMGHAFGDEVLRTFGRTIGSVFRVSDIIGRTGGDEFTIFLEFLKDDENTLTEAQKLVDFFKQFTAGEYVKYSATASIGAAVYPAHGKDFDTLYKAADKALYKAKQRGKNQLAFYDDRDRKNSGSEKNAD